MKVEGIHGLVEWLVGAPEAEQVRRHGPMPGLGEYRQHAPEQIGPRGLPVHAEECRLRVAWPCIDVVQAQPGIARKAVQVVRCVGEARQVRECFFRGAQGGDAGHGVGAFRSASRRRVERADSRSELEFYRSLLRSPRTKPDKGTSKLRPSAITLNSSPISLGLTNFCTPAASVQILGRGLDWRSCEQLGDSQVHQPVGLRRIAHEAEATLQAGAQDSAEVHVRCDVLQAGPEERIGMRAMPVVAHERAGAALGMVVLPFSEAIVDQQHDPTLQHGRERAHQRTGGEAYFAHVRSRRVESECCMQELWIDNRTVFESELTIAQNHTALDGDRVVPGHQMHRQRVQHLVAEDHAGESIRQPIQPLHTGCEPVRQPPQQFALPRAQLRAHLEDEVVLGRATKRIERTQQIGGHAPGPRSELQDLAATRTQHLADLASQRGAEQGRHLGRCDKVTACTQLASAGDVIAKARLVQGHVHVAIEAEPAAARGDRLGDAPTQGSAVCLRLRSRRRQRRIERWQGAGARAKSR